jgi:ribosomal protein S18 acetylase RimI-like enzyme
MKSNPMATAGGAALTGPFDIRPIAPGDSIAELTQLLHRSYASLEAMGFRYLATHQSEAVTRERIENGTCFVGVAPDGGIVATVTVHGPEVKGGAGWYDRPGVASLSQLAVDPAHQRAGLGGRLVAQGEHEARRLAADEIALDTAEGATHLIAWYGRLGFRVVDRVSWSVTNYESVVMSKPLFHVRSFDAADERAVLQLWDESGITRPWNDPVKDIRRKLLVQPELFLVGTYESELVATAMTGYDGHRGWIYYFAVAPVHRRRGFGRMIMADAEALLRARGCSKINLQVRTGNDDAIAFYRRIGFAIDDVIGMGKRLEQDDA